MFNEMEIQKAMSERAVIYGILCRQKLQGGMNVKDKRRDKYQHSVFNNQGEVLACILNAFS